jgi:hypothetical protein
VCKIPIFEPTPEEVISLVQCGDYLQSDYLMNLCAAKLKNFNFAKKTSLLEDFNPDIIPSHVFEKLIDLEKVEESSQWSNIIENWCCAENSGVYRILNSVCKNVSK